MQSLKVLAFYRKGLPTPDLYIGFFCKVEQILHLVLRDWGSDPITTAYSCVTFGELLNLSKPGFTCKRNATIPWCFMSIKFNNCKESAVTWWALCIFGFACSVDDLLPKHPHRFGQLVSHSRCSGPNVLFCLYRFLRYIDTTFENYRYLEQLWSHKDHWAI